MSEERFLSASELATAVGCTRKAVRLYEAHGLLAPARRYGNRRYGTEAYHRLRLIVALRSMDVSIAHIEGLFQVRSCEDVAGAVAAKLSIEISDLVRDVTRQLEDLVQVRQRLISARETLTACSTCTKPPSACAECAAAGKLDSASRVLLAGGGPPEMGTGGRRDQAGGRQEQAGNGES